MGLKHTCTVRLLTSTQSGDIEFFTPQASHETMLVQVPPHTQEDLFIHRFQTDQLLVVKGSLVMVILQNNQYDYILLSDCYPKVLTIPPGILHGVVNLSAESCLVINAVLRHGPAHEKDYQPRKPPVPYDLVEIRRKLMQLEFPVGV